MREKREDSGDCLELDEGLGRVRSLADSEAQVGNGSTEARKRKMGWILGFTLSEGTDAQIKKILHVLGPFTMQYFSMEERRII